MVTWMQLMAFPAMQSGCAVREERPAQMLTRYEKLWPYGVADDETTLYLIQADALPTLFFYGKLNAVIVSDHEMTDIPAALCNCAILPSVGSRDLLAALSVSFRREAELRGEIQKLLTMAREEVGIQRMTDELSRWLGRPVAVVDSAFRFVARAMGDMLESFVPQEDRDPEGLTEERLKSLMQSGVLAEAMSSRAPRYYRIEDFTIYSIPLYLKDTNVGLLGIPGLSGSGTDKLPVEYSNELESLALPFELAFAVQSRALHKRRQNLAFMFSYLLEQEPEDDAHVAERLRLFGYTLLPDMYLVCVKSTSGEKPDGQVVPDTLRNIFSNSFYLCNSDELLFLVSRPAGRELSGGELQFWSCQLESMGLSAGISRVFTDFRQLHRVHYREATLAQQVGRHMGKPVCCFEECAVDAMLLDHGNRDMLPSFCYAPLLRLIRYDREKNTELADTLSVWMKNGRQPKSVCEQMFIHRNTLYKRLRKIEEIMACDLDDPEVIMQIQLTFHILAQMASEAPRT